MIRMQIQLTEEQHLRLHEIAARTGRSMAELVREGVDHLLARTDSAGPWSALRAVAGTARDREGRADVSERHDDHLAEAWHGRPGVR